MVKPASDTVGFLTRQCQPHLLTGLLLTNELQDFVKKNTRSNTIKNKTIIHKQCHILVMPASVLGSLLSNRRQHHWIFCIVDTNAGITEYYSWKGLMPYYSLIYTFVIFWKDFNSWKINWCQHYLLSLKTLSESTITYDNNCKLMILASLDSEYENHKC